MIAEAQDSSLEKALIRKVQGFFQVHLGSPWNAALTFKKKY